MDRIQSKTKKKKVFKKISKETSQEASSIKKSCFFCGHCCMAADLILGEITSKESIAKWKDKAKWLNLHRCDTSTRMNAGKTYFMVRIPFLCANLSRNAKTGKFFCIDYDNRPEMCKSFKCEMIQNKRRMK